jgi:hypothetical protein
MLIAHEVLASVSSMKTKTVGYCGSQSEGEVNNIFFILLCSLICHIKPISDNFSPLTKKNPKKLKT